MKDIKQIIGINLRYIRYQSGLSQEKFYANYNMNPKYLASIERGEINMSVEYLYELAKAMKTTICELVTYDERKIIKQKRIDAKEKQHN